jgi:hypothetical protein
MTHAEREVLKETVAVVVLMLDRLQWNDIGRQYFERIHDNLQELSKPRTSDSAEPNNG